MAKLQYFQYCQKQPKLSGPETKEGKIQLSYKALVMYNFDQHQERQHTKRTTHKKRSQDGEKVAPSIIMTSINVPTMDPSLHVVHNGVPSIKDPEDPEAQLSRDPKSWI